ncbi:MAG TPA: MOSC N-terminal beta barrel domain-containing protein, partial [Sphingomicrobium sp.]|nr:MOSC N-terminal beta barrel domain-containing protein [Sphingomicrobium sp.]
MAQIGSIAALRRYPIKSMLGEDQVRAQVTSRGLAGDRIYALIDVQTGKVVSAKLPHRWRGMLQVY